jgi:tRNA dimethylallyltransferase
MSRRILLIAGTTASGKSSLALALSQRLDGIIVNADALQVYAKWQVLTARPSADDLAQAPHALYGYVDEADDYSVGHWLQAVTALLQDGTQNLIIVGGTGLYFSALLNGLSQIPAVPADIRQAGNDHRMREKGAYFLKVLRKENPVTLERIDINNTVRLQRAWEVLVSTGHGLDYWHSRPTRAPLALASTTPMLLNSETAHTNARIDRRFDEMMRSGAIEECQAAAAGFDPHLPANRAIGAREIIAAIRGEISFEAAASKAKILTHQYAKRQRTWFKSKMKAWRQIDISKPVNMQDIADEITKDMR